MILFIGIFFAGCGKEKEPKQILLDSIKKNAEIKSSSFDVKIDLTLDTSKLKGTNQELAPLQILNEVHMSINGKQTVEPMQYEGNLHVQGMNLIFDFPMILKENTFYMKLPAMIQSQIGDPKKQYVSLDMTEFEKTNDPQKTAEDNEKLAKVILNSLDGNAFIKEDSKKYSLTDGKVENAITIAITKENLKPFLQKFMAEGLPVLLEQYEKYAITDENKKELQKLKDELNKNKAQIDKTIKEIDKYLNLNTFKTTSVIDKDGFERKMLSTFDALVNLDQEGSIGIKLNVEVNQNDINKEQKFEMQIPSKEQTIDLNELENENMTLN